MSRAATATVAAHALIALMLLGCDRPNLEPAVDSSDGRELFDTVAAAPCSPPTAARATGDTVEVNDRPPYPCRLRFRETGIVLRGDSAGRWPDPGANVARDSRGRFFSSVLRFPNQIAVWNPDGTFSHALARAGQGPGELSGSWEPLVFVDRGDSLWVRTDNGAWSVWGPDLQFVRRVQHGNSAGSSYNRFAHVRDGIIISYPTGGNAAQYFTFASTRGPDVRTFGPISDEIRVREMGMVQRSIAASGDTAFWAGPVVEAAQGYVMDLWSAGGSRVRTYRREVSWFFRGEPLELGNDVGSVHSREPNVSEPRRPAKYPRSPSIPQPLNTDENGRLLVYVEVQNDRWRPDTANRLPVGATKNLHLEVLDPVAGRVLASESVSLWARMRGATPGRFFPGTRYGYYTSRSDDGVPSVHIVEYMLTAP